jgi:multimeric flavodoxin WrbA
VTLTDFQRELCTSSRWDFSDLRALYVNCTLKPSPELSHTQGLMDVSRAIMDANGVRTDLVRAVDFDLAPGTWPDMREHGAATDDWPELYERVQAADVLVLGSPIWLGEKSSVCTRVIERLYACSSLLNEEGQYAYYGKVGGCLITGNEDGIKHCSMSVLYSLQHLGYTIPPQADAGWIGEAGLSGSRFRRPRERLHEQEHDLHDVERAPPRADDQGRGRDSGSREPAGALGRGVSIRLRQSRLPIAPPRAGERRQRPVVSIRGRPDVRTGRDHPSRRSS